MLRRTSSGHATLLAPSALAALRAALRRFEWRTRERGLVYADNGAVTRVLVDETGARAHVRGTRVYETAWSWGATSCMPTCSCPVGPYCKHAFALACVLLGEAELEHDDLDGDALDELDEDTLLDELDEMEVPYPAHTRGPGPRSSSEGRRTPRSPPPSPLDRIRSAAAPWERQAALFILLTKAPVPGLHQHPEIVASMEDPDPELRCWRLARALAQRTNGWVPRDLTPYVDQPALAARHRDRARRLLATELVEWGRRRGSAPRRQLRVLLGLAATRAGSAVVTLEVRLTSTRLLDAPRNFVQLQQLRSEVRRDPLAVAPEHAALLESIGDGGVGAGFGTIFWMPGAPLRSFLARAAAPRVGLSLIHNSDPTRLRCIAYSLFCG
jgi:hypothetical protein